MHILTSQPLHGTAVAGVAAAATNNALGIAGITWFSPVLPVKVLGADGSGAYSNIVRGITFAADAGARIINLSLGGTSSSRSLQDAVNYAWNKSAVIIAAAGNNGNNIAFYPAACTNVVAVSATDANDLRPSWSNFGTYVDLSAPGVNILTTQNGNGYTYINGTSFSSPVTSGVAALVASTWPVASNAQIVDLLIKNSDDIGAASYDIYYGHGRVNAARAVNAARNAASADTTAPRPTSPRPPPTPPHPASFPSRETAPTTSASPAWNCASTAPSWPRPAQHPLPIPGTPASSPMASGSWNSAPSTRPEMSAPPRAPSPFPTIR